MQPIVGAIADRSTSRLGRRRPFMLGGSLITSVCLVLLGWTKEIVSIFLSDGADGKPDAYKQQIIIVTAVLAIYGLDFAINAVQACCRSIIVDVLPISQQQTGSAWAARMAASGHVIGFLIGTFDLVKIFPTWLGGDTQFKKMCLVAVVGLWFAIGLTSWAVTERRLLRSGDEGQSVVKVMTTLWKRIWNLPSRIQMICWSQFWGWIGWFPFLFYSSTWVGETYYRYEHPELQPGQSDNHDALGNIGRLGSLSLVLFSIITFTSSVLLPYMVRKPEDELNRSKQGRFTPRPPPGLAKDIQKFLMRIYESPKPDLITTWGLSNLTFAAIMFWAPFVRSLRFATTLVALCGIPWAVSCWAPFAEMGVEINRLAHGGTANGSADVMLRAGGYRAVRPSMEVEDNDDDIELASTNRGHGTTGTSNAGALHLAHSNDGSDGASGELAGVYLGVLNVYTTLPQFVGTFISWIVFTLFEPNKEDVADDSPEHHKYLDLKGVNAIAICLFIGAICAVGAAEATRRLKTMS